MKIASWNVNSVKARLPAVIDWLETAAPDVLALQEIKCTADTFPFLEIEAAGYRATVLGQKTYNGVALISKSAPGSVHEGLPDDGGDDEQARYVEAVFDGVRVASIYLPNGNPVESDKFPYKLCWMARLKRHAARLLADEIPTVLGGDFNVIPEPEDCYDPDDWTGDALYRPESRRAFREILYLGWATPSGRSMRGGAAPSPSGTTSAAAGRGAKASASTTCCCRRRRWTGWRSAISTRSPAADRKPPTIRRSGAASLRLLRREICSAATAAKHRNTGQRGCANLPWPLDNRAFSKPGILSARRASISETPSPPTAKNEVSR